MNRLLILTSLFFACVSCSECNGALYRIYENGLYGFIDSAGNVKIKPQFKYASDFQEGVALVISDVICTDDGYHCCPEKFYHKVGCSTEPASGTLTGVVG